MGMSRLIDADAYIAEYQVAADTARKIGGTEMNMLADFYCEVIKEIKKRPTVDAVPVIYCEDCKYRVLDTVNGEDWCNHTLGLCSEVYATDFCCHGERKDNETV